MVAHLTYKKLYSCCLVMLIVVAISCSQNDKFEDYHDSTVLLTETLEHCGVSVYAALYHTEPNLFFDDPGSWAGQPVHTFQELISDSLKIELIIKLGNKLSDSENESSADGIYQPLIQWCSAEHQFRELSNKKSMEEVISLAFESELFNDAFLRLPDRFHKLEQEFGPLDAAATLSSAELNQFYAGLITEFARNDSIQINAQLEFDYTN